MNQCRISLPHATCSRAAQLKCLEYLQRIRQSSTAAAAATLTRTCSTQARYHTSTDGLPPSDRNRHDPSPVHSITCKYTRELVIFEQYRTECREIDLVLPGDRSTGWFSLTWTCPQPHLWHLLRTCTRRSCGEIQVEPTGLHSCLQT